MTARTSAPLHAHESSSSRTMSKKCSQTIKSIKKFSPSPAMAKGATNPLTLHAVNDDLFPRLWSFLAEIMLVEGSLFPSTKEAISWMVNSKYSGAATPSSNNSSNKKNKIVDPFEMAIHAEALRYAERLLNDQDELGSSSNWQNNQTSCLSRSGRAEAALVVLLFSHLNRTTTALHGEQGISTAMANVSPSQCDGSSSSKNMLKRMISKSQQPKSLKAGFTSPLFSSTSSAANRGTLPEHLRGSAFAGDDCAIALGRLVAWVDSYEEQLLAKGVLTSEILQILNDDSNVPMAPFAPETAPWSKKLQTLDGTHAQDLTHALLLVSYAPESVPDSAAWASLNQTIGNDNATAMVIWWSLRLTLQGAQGLHTPRRSSNSSHNSGSTRRSIGQRQPRRSYY
ncbi:expressed unknown protein [Seminavis robusta]|uniref:Uncharacterized protein n=1 Tax=Seminavis robusta TaxID=568900 RepID=A0A9N8HJ00_9STRA|nr:expressed unknown protein [Seminavis robusta]|eukprot:Sro658_g182680.1 n/a (397) ;mRNA; r:12289-13479